MANSKLSIGGIAAAQYAGSLWALPWLVVGVVVYLVWELAIGPAMYLRYWPPLDEAEVLRFRTKNATEIAQTIEVQWMIKKRFDACKGVYLSFYAEDSQGYRTDLAHRRIGVIDENMVRPVGETMTRMEIFSIPLTATKIQGYAAYDCPLLTRPLVIPTNTIELSHG